jgi:(2Fe-2S) ferredoxin
MTPLYFKTSGHLLVCQHVNCKARGSDMLYKALWNALDTHKLAYFKTGGSVRLTESGCLGACSYGPVMCVYRRLPDSSTQGQLEEGWYNSADLPLALKVAQAVHEGAELPTDRKYGP